jgi:hypothetical protein
MGGVIGLKSFQKTPPKNKNIINQVAIKIGTKIMENEFKFSTLRQFGSENISFTATIKSNKEVLTPEQIDAQISQVDGLIRKAFIAVQEREISEKALLAEASDRRTAEVAKLDASLKLEMEQKKVAQRTIDEAIRLDKKFKK